MMPAYGQVGYLWTPEELTEKADIVAIVDVISAQDTGRTQRHPSLRSRLPVVEMEAELRVLAWLKPSAGSNSAPNTLRLVSSATTWSSGSGSSLHRRVDLPPPWSTRARRSG